MFDDKTRKFTFRCDDCKQIMFSEFSDEDDITDILDNKLWLECDCNGKAKLLRD